MCKYAYIIGGVWRRFFNGYAAPYRIVVAEWEILIAR